MGTIQYMPLDPSKTEIRLIKLSPRATNTYTQRERAPRCSLTHVSLDDKPDYVALSYTWGDPQDTEIITVEQSSVSVTRNLHSALEHLRYNNTDRVFWIDALCINQSDNEEKGWQVQLMREIYQRATSVSIWLGPADATSDKVVDFLNVLGTKAMSFGLDQGPNIIRRVSEQWRKLASHPLSFRDRSRQRVTVEDGNAGARVNFLMRDLNELYYSISGSHGQDRLFPVEGMASLFKRAWWGRIWVLQELSLAQKAGFVCGMKRLSRRRCTAALNAFNALGLVFQEMHMLKGVMGTAYQSSVAMADFDWRPTVLLSMWNTHRRSPYPLLALLRATCIAGLYSTLQKEIMLEATNPRDKIYGLLGLAADRDKLKGLGFLPDYTRSCQDVYISIAAAMLRQGHLSALSLSQFSKAQTGLPSWVPDWSKPLGDTLQGVSTDHMTPDPEYNASGSLLQTEPIFSGIGATTSISVSGIAYDEVHDLGATWKDFCSLEYTTHPFVPAKRLLEELVRLSFLRDKIFKDLKERICAAARTVIAEIGYNDNGRWARIGNQRYHTAVSLMMIPVNSPCEMNLPNSGFLELIKSDGIQPGIDMVSASKYCGEIAAKAHRRKPFVTAKGYLGLGPDHIKPGDVIAILIGSQVPFVLRKSVDRKYEIVGEAYVDGIMNGEAVAGRESVGALELI